MNIESRLCSSNKPQFALLEMGVHVQIYETELSEFEFPYYWQRSCAELCEGEKKNGSRGSIEQSERRYPSLLHTGQSCSLAMKT